MIYVDTSALAAVFFREATARQVLKALRAESRTPMVISAWTLTELASVGSIKARTGAVSPAERATALGAFQRFVSAKLRIVEVEPADFRTATVLVEQSADLRAGDALHLAIARRIDARLATLDRRLGATAAVQGLSTLTLVS